ncbi:putative N-formylglutamate amidohydrolase [Rhizobium sp. PP-F2F-G36]|nr:putative N-formylglutamate amidohydrolase [Rhizobium sp. PP-F2F-G36]
MADEAPFEIIRGDMGRGLVLLGDHATNRLPPRYGTLGLAESAFSRHIAYDIGVEPLIRGLAKRLNVPAVMSRYSRLLIDPNRGEDDPTLIMKISDGAIIAGNHPLSEAEAEARLEGYHRPYHRAVADTIAEVAQASGSTPLILSLHSFTPAWKGEPRPWHVTVLWDTDARAVLPLLAALREPGDVVVGDNEPYDGALRGDTLYRHCMETGMPHALIEVRQDEIGTPEGVAAWIDRLAPIFERLNARADLHRTERHPSRTGPYAA